MNEIVLEQEKERLRQTFACIDSELTDVDSRLSHGIEAADAQTVEALTQQFIGRLKVLLLIKDKPYFARVDFAPQGRPAERLYIGKTTVLDGRDEAVVVDWRAPVSTLYYDGRLGEAAYECPDGVISGEISLKRRFEIENRTLTDYSDIDVTFDEELLRPYLDAGSGTRLKNIIATIQSEQNRIIRAGLTRPLIVQGVAGSGKTTVALHRIAYLIYTYSASIRAGEFLIIAPNALFLDYISGILPDLGVENVRQTTYEQLAQDILGRRLTVGDSSARLVRILQGGAGETEMQASSYLSSLRFCDAVGRYLAEIEQNLLPPGDFCAGRYPLLGRDSLLKLFTEDFSALPFARRVEAIRERLKALLAEQGERVLHRIDQRRARLLAALPAELDAESFRARKRDIYGEEEELVRDLVSGGKKTLAAYLKKIRLPSALECYRGLVGSEEALARFAPELVQEVRRFIAGSSKGLAKGRVEYEDLAPLIYLHHRIHGADPSLSARHTVIDEAQDFSSFQFFAVREALRCRSMTIFGDLAQGIYGYRGTNDWNDVAADVFGGACDILTLQKSYRSTVEIMEQANRVLARIPGLGGVARAEAVIRHGEPVRYLSLPDADAEADVCARRIREQTEAGLKNIAVICKTLPDCEAFAEKLAARGVTLTLLGGREYAGGVSVVPSYLVKGLEFDAVLITDAQKYGESGTDRKLLYVAMTRAMHGMDILYTGAAPAVLSD